MTVKIVGPKSITLPSALGGDDQMYGLVLVCVTRGLFVKNGGETATIEGITDLELLNKSMIQLCVSKGCKIYNYPSFVKANPEDVVPEGVPNRLKTVVDEETGESSEVIKTWNEWKLPHHYFQERDNDGVTETYLPFVVPDDGLGSYIEASVWVPLDIAGTITVIDTPTFISMAPEVDNV